MNANMIHDVDNSKNTLEVGALSKSDANLLFGEVNTSKVSVLSNKEMSETKGEFWGEFWGFISWCFTS